MKRLLRFSFRLTLWLSERAGDLETAHLLTVVQIARHTGRTGDLLEPFREWVGELREG